MASPTIPLLCCLAATLAAGEATRWVRPDGDDAQAGTADTAQAAWRSIDRGQPSRLALEVGAGSTTLRLAHAVRFPAQGHVRIAQQEFAYTSLHGDILELARPAPALRAGTRVESVEWPPPGPGTQVNVAPGAWTLDRDSAKAAVTITSGGEAERPVRFSGHGLPILDGRDRGAGLSLSEVRHVIIDGFDIRRGGVRIADAAGITVSSSRIHAGDGCSVNRSTAVAITGNRIYDIYGAWTRDPLGIHQSAQCSVLGNTIAGCGQTAIQVSGACPDLAIRRNLITAVRRGIAGRDDATWERADLGGNCLWLCGAVHWLHQAGDKGGVDYYAGLPFIPEDLHADPQIAVWDSAASEFLAVAPGSPCATGPAIGAVGPHPYPATAQPPQVVNGGFDAGWYGWTTLAESSSTTVTWALVDGATGSGQAMRMVNQPAPGGRNAAALASLMFPLQRGQPVTVRLRARGEALAAGGRCVLDVGLGFPSSANQSVSSQPLQLTTTWTDYTCTFTIPAYYPDLAAISLSPGLHGFCAAAIEVDAIAVAHGEATVPVEVLPAAATPGCLVPPAQALGLRILGHDLAEARLQWRLEEPMGGIAGEGTLAVGRSPALASLVLPAPARGAMLLRWSLRNPDGGAVAAGSLPLVVGWPVPAGRNRAFWGATPAWRPLPAAEPFLAGISALGLGTMHLYLGLDRMAEVQRQAWAETFVDQARRAGLQWLWTVDDGRLFTGARTWAPGPDDLTDGAPITISRAADAQARLTPERLAIWHTWVGAIAAKYRDRVRCWEIANEPNCYLSAGEYLHLLASTAALLRQHAPEATLIGGSVVNAPRKELWARTIAEGARHFDLFSFHPYRFGRSNPESEAGSHRQMIRDAFSDLGWPAAGKGLYLTEEGMGPGWETTRCLGRFLSFATFPRLAGWGRDEELHAQYAARMWATALGEGARGYSYHTLKSLVKDELGMPNLAFAALHAMASRLVEAVPAGALDLGPDYRGYLFGVGDQAVAAVWPVDAEWAEPITVAVPAGIPLRVGNLFGNPLPLGRDGSFRHGRELVYLDLERSVDSARLTVPALYRHLRSRTGRPLP